MEEIEIDLGLSGADTDDLALQVRKTEHEIKELKEYLDLLKAELANRAIDQPLKILNTAYGSYKARWSPANRTWKREEIAQEVFNLAKRGELHEPDKDGELPGTPEWRVFDSMKRMFLLQPRIGQVKAIDLDPDEFSTTEGQGKWVISKMKSDES
jgi:hypothetical protein